MRQNQITVLLPSSASTQSVKHQGLERRVLVDGSAAIEIFRESFVLAAIHCCPLSCFTWREVSWREMPSCPAETFQPEERNKKECSKRKLVPVCSILNSLWAFDLGLLVSCKLVVIILTSDRECLP